MFSLLFNKKVLPTVVQHDGVGHDVVGHDVVGHDVVGHDVVWS